MNFKTLFFCACFASHLQSASAETVVKILHLQSNAQIKAIWQEAAQKFESIHPRESQWIQIAMDQLLGPDTGRVLNDASADLASGNTTPEKAAKALEASWQQNKP